MARPEINQPPSHTMAEDLLAVAEQFSIDIGAPDFSEVILATARVLQEHAYRPTVIARTIKHSGGLLGCYGLILEGDSENPIGLDGARTWDAIRKIALRKKGYGRGKFLGEGQEVVFTSDNQFLDQHQEGLISQTTAMLRSHLQAQQMALNTTYSSSAATAPRL